VGRDVAQFDCSGPFVFTRWRQAQCDHRQLTLDTCFAVPQKLGCAVPKAVNLYSAYVYGIRVSRISCLYDIGETTAFVAYNERLSE